MGACCRRQLSEIGHTGAETRTGEGCRIVRSAAQTEGVCGADLYVDQVTGAPTRRNRRLAGKVEVRLKAAFLDNNRGVIRSLRLHTDGHLSRGGLRPPQPIKRVLQWRRQPHRVGSSGPRPGQVRRSQSTSKRSNRLQNTETAPRGRHLYFGASRDRLGAQVLAFAWLSSSPARGLVRSGGNSPRRLHAES